jgi:hypothetical protein
MIGYRSEHSPRFWVEKELYWDPKKTFRQKTNSEYADDIARFIDGHNVRGIYLDPSAESFSVELKRRQIRCLDAENDVFAGITFVANLFANHQLKLLDCCPNLIRELEQYVWDSKKAARGIEEPVKKEDHCCVTGDTRILMGQGFECPIESYALLNCTNMPIINYNEKRGTAEFDTALQTKLTRRRAEIFELELEDGTKLKATGDHKVLTQRGWIELQQLTLSDIIMTWNINNTLEKDFI